jgi:DNA-binding XRE family transcriptional regulator
MDTYIIMVMTPTNLKAWRKKHGYRQVDLAKALGVIPLTVIRWETGVRNIPSFLHLALRCLELEGGGKREGKRKR